jgi:multidrug efflux system membrane fusion protein
MHGEAPKRKTVTQAGTGRRVAVWGLLAVLLAAGAYFYFAPASQQAQRAGRGRFDGPTPVVATPAQRADVPVYLEAVGTTRALNTVTVRAQVDGKLLSVGFNEGQDVKKGDILARIDPTTYQAQLNQAVAKKAQDEAQLGNAKLDLERYARLAASNSINRQQADTQQALVAQLDAQVKSDQAAIDNTQAVLSYTAVVAPIDGRAGIRMVDEGNIVRTTDTGIVVITQLRPIGVLFSLPQQELERVNAAFAKGPLDTDALRSDNDAVIDRGKLTVVDNQVDQQTGTVRLKSEFPNANLQLWPGQFVNVRVLIDTLKQVVVVPTGAVQRGPRGTFVYVVKDDNTVAMKTVTTGQQDDVQTVITEGVEPPERVVTTGFARLSDGGKVTVSEPGQSPAAQPIPRRDGAPAGRERRRNQGGASGGAGGGAAQ